MLSPILDPLDGPFKDPGSDGDGDLLGICQVFCPETSANFGSYDVDAPLIGIQKLDQHGPQFVRHLGRAPNCQAIVEWFISCDNSATFKRMRSAAMLLELQRKYVPRIGECSIGVAIVLFEFGENIARFIAMDPRRIWCDGRAAVGHRGQRSIIDVD